MSDYKRLTKQAGWHKEIDLKDELGYSYIYQRLAELENKIEQGMLIELKDRKPLMWGRDGDTIHCQHCGKDLMGVFDGETVVIQCPKCGGFVDGLVAEDYNEELLKELQNGEN